MASKTTSKTPVTKTSTSKASKAELVEVEEVHEEVTQSVEQNLIEDSEVKQPMKKSQMLDQKYLQLLKNIMLD